jgi:hypothetical protein
MSALYLLYYTSSDDPRSDHVTVNQKPSIPLTSLCNQGSKQYAMRSYDVITLLGKFRRSYDSVITTLLGKFESSIRRFQQNTSSKFVGIFSLTFASDHRPRTSTGTTICHWELGTGIGSRSIAVPEFLKIQFRKRPHRGLSIFFRIRCSTHS